MPNVGPERRIVRFPVFTPSSVYVRKGRLYGARFASITIGDVVCLQVLLNIVSYLGSQTQSALFWLPPFPHATVVSFRIMLEAALLVVEMPICLLTC